MWVLTRLLTTFPDFSDSWSVPGESSRLVWRPHPELMEPFLWRGRDSVGSSDDIDGSGDTRWAEEGSRWYDPPGKSRPIPSHEGASRIRTTEEFSCGSSRPDVLGDRGACHAAPSTRSDISVCILPGGAFLRPGRTRWPKRLLRLTTVCHGRSCSPSTADPDPPSSPRPPGLRWARAGAGEASGRHCEARSRRIWTPAWSVLRICPSRAIAPPSCRPPSWPSRGSCTYRPPERRAFEIATGSSWPTDNRKRWWTQPRATWSASCRRSTSTLHTRALRRHRRNWTHPFDWDRGQLRTPSEKRLSVLRSVRWSPPASWWTGVPGLPPPSTLPGRFCRPRERTSQWLLSDSELARCNTCSAGKVTCFELPTWLFRSRFVFKFHEIKATIRINLTKLTGTNVKHVYCTSWWRQSGPTWFLNNVNQIKGIYTDFSY